MQTKRKPPLKKSPWYAPPVYDASFTVGTETSDAITVACQLKNSDGGDVAARARVQAYLSSDANGDVIAASPEGMDCGTDGTMVSITSDRPTGLVTKGTLVIDAVPEKFKTTTTATYKIYGATYTKTAATAITFTLAHVVTASKYGVVLIQINAAGTVSTKVPAATQAYNSAALALAALPAPDAGKIALGYIAIANNTGDWTANTDDLTAASDVTTATFVDGDGVTSVPTQFDLICEADGDIDVVITDTRAPRTYYLNLVMPDGGLKTSGAITFA